MHPECTEALVTDGPYRYTRNPMYVGMLVILTGWAIYLGNVGAFLLLPLFIVVLNRQQIIPEERMLEAKFAGVYRAYRERVPRWF
jgi:protein-S-isoprenylcysteine O-methyltransferase Ste14